MLNESSRDVNEPLQGLSLCNDSVSGHLAVIMSTNAWTKLRGAWAAGGWTELAAGPYDATVQAGDWRRVGRTLEFAKGVRDEA